MKFQNIGVSNGRFSFRGNTDWILPSLGAAQGSVSLTLASQFVLRLCVAKIRYMMLGIDNNGERMIVASDAIGVPVLGRALSERY